MFFEKKPLKFSLNWSKQFIYNDRFFAPGRKSFSNIQYNPYRVFSLSPTLTSSVGPDKWNPADIWIMTPSGIRDLTSFNQKVQSWGPMK